MESFKKLIEILKDQFNCYTDLLNISKSKTDIIVGGKVQELEGITKVEQSIIFKLGDLEDDLQKDVEVLIKDLNINEKDITITTIINHSSGEEKKQLEKLKDDIFKVVQELDHVNKLNSQLIKNSLEFINFSVNLYSNANSDSNGSYEQNGEVRGTKSSFFDMKL
jgi:flagellar biosynthesis/type III secretory pathway chaperone